MMHESEENPAPTRVGFSGWFCVVSKDSGTQACHKAGDIKSVPKARAYSQGVPEV